MSINQVDALSDDRREGSRILTRLAEQYIPGVLDKVKPHHMQKTYEIPQWKDYEDFLELLARKSGRLLKGGEPVSAHHSPFNAPPL